MKKLVLPLLLTAALSPALASDYFVVVPVKGKTPAPPAPEIQVVLNAAPLPDAQTSSAYSYNLAQHLIVTGDAAYSGQGVTWSVSSGALPAGLTLSSTSGQVSGTPAQGGTASFSVTASYKSKSGLQAYQIIVVQGLNKITNAGRTFVQPGPTVTNFTDAQATCASAIDGQTGWRLPSATELGDLHTAKGGSAPMEAAGWPTGIVDWYWTTDVYRGGVWIVWKPYNSSLSICGTNDVCARVICVK